MGENGILMPLIKQLSEAMLKAELETHLETEQTPNRKNGYTAKTIKTTGGYIRAQYASGSSQYL
jgi:putative transposase